MEGPRSSKHNVSVTIERSTRYTILSRLTSKHADNKTKAIVKRLNKLPAPAVRTLTLDNGSENTQHHVISQHLNIKVFFCHPYHSWEKGTVENTVGRIRRYIPKGTDIKQISKSKIQELEYILNNTPRKCLGYLTPYEKMLLELKKISKLT
jgi:IS30 family transposase